VLVDLGIALARSDLARADEVFARAVEAARAAGDPQLEARAALRRIPIRILQDMSADQAAELREAQRYVERFEGWHHDLGIAEARSVVATIRVWQGRMTDAEENLSLAIEHARRAGDHQQEAEALKWLALVIVEGPTPAEEGGRLLDSIAERELNRRIQVAIDQLRVTLEAMRGNFAEGRRLIRRALALSAEQGDVLSLVSGHREAGHLERLAGDLSASEQQFRAAYDLAEGINDLGHLASVAPDLGDAVYELGRYEECLPLSEVGERLTIAGDVDAGTRWRQLRGKALARLGRIDEAIELATEAVELSRPTEYVLLRGHALFALAEVCRLAGRDAAAADALREALELCRAKGNRVGEVRAVALLEELEGSPSA
jgi:tetratricopeptide (TPR) repeat protein